MRTIQSRTVSCLTLASSLLMTTFADAQELRPTTVAGRSTVYAPHGAIATSQPLATAAGLAVLQHGGNAIDAAVTAAAVLNVVEPHMTGLGGDVFSIVWSAAERKLVGLNASGRSGSLMTREALVERGHTEVPVFGAEPVTVPGALSGWVALLRRFGTISLAEALAPAIALAEEGFPVSPIIAAQWAREVDGLKADAGARSTFLIDGSRAPRAGETFRNPDIARTFRRVADEGPAVLYRGSLGREIVDHVRQLGGYLTIEDLASHEVEWVTPLSVRYRDYRLWELPPNGQGIAALEILKILEPYDLRSMGHNSAAYLHHLIEATKLAFADLGEYIADPDHMRVRPEQLLGDEFIASRRALIDPAKALDRPGPGSVVTSSETIYLSVADAEGNMVSLINSVYEYFGSRVVVPGTGFVLQDRGAGFTLEEGHANTVAPRKRPFHTLIPGFVTRDAGNGDEPWLSYGVMGGAMQPQGHVQVLLNVVVFGMDLQQAIDAARYRLMDGRRVAIEPPVGDAVRAGLAAMGHEVLDAADYGDTPREFVWRFGGAQAVMRLRNGWAAGSDPRKDGMAAGH